MAVLEKIRSKSVMLFIIIIVALLAFILGDFFNSGCSRHGDTVAETNGVKVKYNVYSAAVDQNSNLFKQQIEMARMQSPYAPLYNNDVVTEYTIYSLLTQGMLKDELDRMGIVVTDAEISNYMLNPLNGQRVLATMAQDLNINPMVFAQFGITDPATLLDAINRPEQYNLDPNYQQAFASVWKKFEMDMEQSLMTRNYLNLLGGLFTANRIDARNTYNERNTTTTFDYVVADYAQISDDKATISDAEYQETYDQFKGAFKLTEPKRYISYITLGVAPSENDRKLMDDNVQALIADLTTFAGDSAIANHPAFTAKTDRYTRQQLATNQDLRMLAANVDSLVPGAVKQTGVLGNHYAVSKLLSRSTGIDSISYACIEVPAANLDSVAATVTAANIDSLAGSEGKRIASLINPADDLSEKLLSQLENAPLGQIVTFTDTVTNAQGTQAVGYILNVEKRSQPTTVYEILLATAELAPSDATISELAQSLRNYVANNSTLETFNQNAQKAGFNVNKALVSASDPIGDNAPNSLSAIRWVMCDAKQGQVSNVFSLNLPEAVNGSSQYFMAVAVDEVFNDKYMPVTSQYVKDQLNDYCTQVKKAKMIGDKFKAQSKSLASLAAALKTNVAEGSGTFAGQYIMGKMNPALQAAIATAKPGTVVGPLPGPDGAYYVQVKSSKTEGRPYNFAESASAYLSNVMRGFVERTLDSQITPSFELLRGSAKIKNFILEFTRGE